MNNGKNRQGLAAAAALAFGVLVLAVPEAAARGFAGGTALCLQSVLPALFPLFVVCELLTFAPPPAVLLRPCLLYTSPSPRDPKTSRMPSSA